MSEKRVIIPESKGSMVADNLAREIQDRGHTLIVCHQLANGDYEVRWYDSE